MGDDLRESFARPETAHAFCATFLHARSRRVIVPITAIQPLVASMKLEDHFAELGVRSRSIRVNVAE